MREDWEDKRFEELRILFKGNFKNKDHPEENEDDFNNDEDNSKTKEDGLVEISDDSKKQKIG